MSVRCRPGVAGSIVRVFFIQQTGELVRWQRLGNQETLHLTAAELAQRSQVGIAFHPFCDDGQAEPVGQGDDSGQGQMQGGIARTAADQRTIDLDLGAQPGQHPLHRGQD